jgi:hypothetical protein
VPSQTPRHFFSAHFVTMAALLGVSACSDGSGACDPLSPFCATGSLPSLVGFFFGKNGEPPPHEVVRRPHGRIVFAHSELQGNMNMAHAMLEGKRGALEALELI